MYGITQDILNEILPEAFATVKETAKRFVNNPNLKLLPVLLTVRSLQRKLMWNWMGITLFGTTPGMQPENR
jgi:hypothetical protein